MMTIEPDASHTPDVLRDVLGEIEVLRIKRHEEVRDRPHPFLKRFTQKELTDEACPTYKNLLVGRSQRIPSRQTIMHRERGRGFHLHSDPGRLRKFFGKALDRRE